ncbi:hypothetical protein Agub_g2149 [Astrephomene gubernaculifera]|uniref:methenyltetrahydrofolate cyclohydrolase n=1 Tax=Astrephomene gubernaculifera TaxID=47775 RepID=A0AAD3DKC5_9CHLO|nr:hypothetical protein Agub_g2149 [Astrephomene gubernaculifera]
MQRATKSASRLLFSCQQHCLTKRLFATAAAVVEPACSPVSVSDPGSIATTTAICRNSSGHRATVLDGRAVAAAWEKELANDVQLLTKLLGRPPGLGVVLVGSRPDSILYVTKKQEACQKAGVRTFIRQLPESVTQAQLEAAVAATCGDPRVDGVLIQLPLPRHLSEEAVMEVLEPRKDVDGFHPLNMGRMLMRGRGVRLVPATPLGCIELLRRSGVDVQGKTCVVLGDSNIVGTPLAAMLRDRGAAAVTICHRRSYRDWFVDQQEVRRKRAAAAACLPPLPGPSPRPPQPFPSTPAAPSSSSSAAAAASAAATTPEEPTCQQEHPQPLQHQQQHASTGGRVHGSSPACDSSPQCSPSSSSPTLLSSSSSPPVCPASFQSYQLPDLTRSADILVVAVGHPELVRGDWVRPGAVVIDVGINVVGALPRNSQATSTHTSSTSSATSTSGTSSTSSTISSTTANTTSNSGQQQQQQQQNEMEEMQQQRRHQDDAAMHQPAPLREVRCTPCSDSGVESSDGKAGGAAAAALLGSCTTSSSGMTCDSSSSGGCSGNQGEFGSGGGSESGSSSSAGDDGSSLCNRNLTFHVVGDVAFEEVSQVAGAITPVPGGVGPMTIAALLHNTLKAAKYRVGLETW